MYCKALYVCDIRKQREHFKVIDKLLRVFLCSLYLKCEDRTAAVREIFIIKLLLLSCCKRWVVDLFYLRVVIEELYYFKCVFNVAFNTKRERFKSLQEQECVERRECCACITKQDSSDLCNECSCADCFCTYFNRSVSEICQSSMSEAVCL